MAASVSLGKSLITILSLSRNTKTFEIIKYYLNHKNLIYIVCALQIIKN